MKVTGDLLLGKECEYNKSIQDLISKPKNFIELSLGIEERLTAWHLKVLRDFRKFMIESMCVETQNDLIEVKKKCATAYGLALWLMSLAEFSNYTGLLKKAKALPAKKPKKPLQP